MDLSVYGRPAPGRRATSAGSAAQSEASGYTPRAQDVVLTARAQMLIEVLPTPVKPKVLLSYPHVVNRLAELWRTSQPMRRYLQDLLLDSRGTRNGFPPAVIGELSALRSYYENRIHPVRADVWSTVRRRS